MKTKSKLVWNHSTHAPGVIKTMRKLLRSSKVTTVVPGRLFTARGSSPMRFRVTVPIEGGHKMLARCGRMVQEIFVTTSMDKKTLQRAIDEVCRGS